jgi:excisionase family DNA binding protein
MTEPWVSVDDVAAHLGVRKDSIYRWIERRGLPAQKIGKLWKLRLSDVDTWVQTKGATKNDAALSSVARRAPHQFILAVDDDESVRATLRDFLSDEGYGVLEAADGAHALALLRFPGSPRPSLIILDLGMPRMDGWDVREELQRDPQFSQIPIVIVTGDRRADVSGAAAVLRKPLDLDQLATAIRATLDEKGI